MSTTQMMKRFLSAKRSDKEEAQPTRPAHQSNHTDKAGAQPAQPTHLSGPQGDTPDTRQLGRCGPACNMSIWLPHTHDWPMSTTPEGFPIHLPPSAATGHPAADAARESGVRLPHGWTAFAWAAELQRQADLDVPSSFRLPEPTVTDATILTDAFRERVRRYQASERFQPKGGRKVQKKSQGFAILGTITEEPGNQMSETTSTISGSSGLIVDQLDVKTVSINVTTTCVPTEEEARVMFEVKPITAEVTVELMEGEEDED